MLRALELWRGLSNEIQGDTGYKENGCPILHTTILRWIATILAKTCEKYDIKLMY